ARLTARHGADCRRMPSVRRLLAVLAVAGLGAAAALAPAPAGGQQDAPEPSLDTNPCHDPFLALECPDLRMAPPSDLHVRRVGNVVRLLAANHIVNVGQGPLELRADHHGVTSRFAPAYQVVRDQTGMPFSFPEAGWVYFKAIPGQGHYWKYWRAARFELWTLNADGTRGTMVRTGPKLSYCLRDLQRVRNWQRTPRRRIYHACSQDGGRQDLRLGVSPGWADVYPSTYHENWISITHLTGCFAFVHRADPLDDIIEEHEDNNIGQRVIRLPPRNGSVAPRGCPQPR
ncbi:MAG: hypothetical protein QOK49_2729, partial [Baekduia sp.]|nr:hypothetical protein [Baekduia sp.]